ncbi:30S ribosomal protein S9 [Patescibacteria group bacterium]|nr:30S ribosomal protein S9 [Patescibacteria group bacterium]
MPKVTKKTKTKTKPDVYFEAVGRRKSAIARVRLFKKPQDGKKLGEMITNGKELSFYFPLVELREILNQPFRKTKTEKKFYTSLKISGGGTRSQAEAARLGISRALLKFNEDFRKILKGDGFLTRDARVKERRKFGLKKARKAPQWSKR